MTIYKEEELALVKEVQQLASRYVGLTLMLENAHEGELPKTLSWEDIQDLFLVRGELEAVGKINQIMNIRKERFRQFEAQFADEDEVMFDSLKDFTPEQQARYEQALKESAENPIRIE